MGKYLVVCITAKIHFLKQFTTGGGQSRETQRCLYYCKDTLFEAIHNYVLCRNLFLIVVCITAKIHFLKQFTTTTSLEQIDIQLFVLLQRYTF